MKTFRGKIDTNDLECVTRIRKKTPIVAVPCPFVRGRIHPNTTAFLFGDGTITQVFHVKPIYYEALDETWRPISEIATHFGHKKITLRDDWDKFVHPSFLRWWIRRMELIGGEIKIPSPLGQFVPIREGQEIHFTVTTVYPNPNPETTSVDGFAFPSESPTCESWAGKHDDNTGAQKDDADTTISVLINTAGCSDPNWSNISRGFTLFDTSSIPDTDTIDSAIWSGYVTTVNDNFNASYVVIKTDPASNTAIAGTDYYRNNLVAGDGTKVATAVDLTGLSTSAYKDSSLDATGLAAISKTGVSKFGFVIEHDADNSPPTWTSASARVIISSADTTGTSQDPKLAVTHTAAVVAGMSLLTLMGVG